MGNTNAILFKKVTYSLSFLLQKFSTSLPVLQNAKGYHRMQTQKTEVRESKSSVLGSRIRRIRIFWAIRIR